MYQSSLQTICVLLQKVGHLDLLQPRYHSLTTAISAKAQLRGYSGYYYHSKDIVSASCVCVNSITSVSDDNAVQEIVEHISYAIQSFEISLISFGLDTTTSRLCRLLLPFQADNTCWRQCVNSTTSVSDDNAVQEIVEHISYAIQSFEISLISFGTADLDTTTPRLCWLLLPFQAQQSCQ